MAYNSYAFETVYGFSLLDEIHNFFPELMYDNTLFNSESMSWMRFRINTLFPQVYVRQQNLYNLYSANQRMSDYVQWHHNRAPVPILQPPATPRRAPPTFNRRNHSAAPHPPRTPFVVEPVDISGARVMAPTFYTSLMYDIRDSHNIANNLLNLFTNFQDVPVAPSGIQIDQASTIRIHEDIPAETDCSICMEHNANNGELNWRELRCGHIFHRACIDTWLGSHVQCPICRTDIRNMQRDSNTHTN